MHTEFISRSEEQTATLAAGIARLLNAGDTVYLKGQLGTGKTFFVRAVAREFGISEPVTSPSYTIANTYSGKMTIHHLDLYRLSNLRAEEMADFEPFFEGDGITFVEWPQLVEPILGEPALLIEFEHIDENSRRLRMKCNVDRISAGLEKLFAKTGN